MSNNGQFMQNVTEEDRAAGETANVLGLQWNARTDTLGPKEIPPMDQKTPCTKRTAVQHLAKVFDPTGFINPVTIKGKILLQFMWKNEFQWDTPLPEKIAGQWRQFELIEFTRSEQILHYSTLHRDRHTNAFAVFCRCQSGGIFCQCLCLPSNSSGGQLSFGVLESQGCSSQPETHSPKVGTQCCCAGCKCNAVCVFRTESPGQWHVVMERFPNCATLASFQEDASCICQSQKRKDFEWQTNRSRVRPFKRKSS